MWLVYSLLSNIGIFYLERTYRTVNEIHFDLFLLQIIATYLITQFLIFKLFSTAPSLILAGAVFSVANGILRIINSHMIGEPVSWQVYMFVAIMLCCAVGISYFK